MEAASTHLVLVARAMERRSINMLLERFSYPLRRRHVINPLSPGVLKLRNVVNSLVPGRTVLGRVHLSGGDVVDLEHQTNAKIYPW